MDLTPKKRLSSRSMLPERPPIEEWWVPGSSSSGTIVFLCALTNTYASMHTSLTIFASSPDMRFAMQYTSSSTSPAPNGNPTLRHRNSQNKTKFRKTFIPPPLQLTAIEEETGLSEYECGYLNLGAESPASESTPSLVDTKEFVEQWATKSTPVPRPLRRPSSSSLRERGRSTGLRKETVDRDCGICFEYAVTPCRTLCCGKIFCTEHLSDWLHGPNAEGRCPNCENACALEGGTLSLAVPPLRPKPQTLNRKPPSKSPPRSRAKQLASSPLILVQSHSNDTMDVPRDLSHRATTAAPSRLPQLLSPPQTTLNTPQDSQSSRSSSRTTTSGISNDSEATHRSNQHLYTASHQLNAPTSSSLNLSTTPFSASWGAWSRLMSIVTFLMFIYKLLS